MEENVSQNNQIPPASDTVPPAISQADLAKAEAIAGSTREPFYKNKKILIITGVIVLVVILIVFVVAVFALKPKPKIITLTEGQANSTIHVKPNDTVVINTKEPAGDDMNIGTGISNPSVLHLNGKSFGPGTGNYNGKFTAVAPGETDIVVTAAPVCKKGEFCTPMQILVYKAHIVVDK